MLPSLECVSVPARTKFPLESPYGHLSSPGLLGLPEGLIESPLQHSDTGWRHQRTWSGSHSEAFPLESRTWLSPSLAPKLTVCPSTRTKNRRIGSRKWLGADSWARGMAICTIYIMSCVFHLLYIWCMLFASSAVHYICAVCHIHMFLLNVSGTNCVYHVSCMLWPWMCHVWYALQCVLCNTCMLYILVVLYASCFILAHGMCIMCAEYCVSHKRSVHIRRVLCCVDI